MAAHYDTAILPARPRRPRDKAKVEVAVLIVERWLLGACATVASTVWLNSIPRSASCSAAQERMPIWRLGFTRRALFEELDRSLQVS